MNRALLSSASGEAEAPASVPLARVRARTISRKQLRREQRRQPSEPVPDDIQRPTFRLECELPWGERPCVFVGCRFHLAYDVHPRTGSIKENFPGSIKENFPGKEIEDLEETCALDIAERGGVTLEEVARLLNLTRERVRQIESAALRKLEART